MGRRVTSMVALLFLGALVVMGCGKPEYCSKVNDLRASLGTMKDDLGRGNAAAIQTEFETVKSNTDAVGTAAESDFPKETRALQSSISKLTSAIAALPTPPSRNDAMGLVDDVDAVSTAVNKFKSATRSKC